jgi:threonine synthase
LLALGRRGRLPAGAVVVCVLTGHGLKDPAWGLEGAEPPTLLGADARTIALHLGLERRT